MAQVLEHCPPYGRPGYSPGSQLALGTDHLRSEPEEGRTLVLSLSFFQISKYLKVKYKGEIIKYVFKYLKNA